MFKYKGVHCPHCGKEFKEDDSILICPECGAPYHQHCIQELGACMFGELHAKGESWQPPKSAAEEAEERCDGMASRRCSRCGTVNNPDKLFCEVCGTPLNQENEKEQPNPTASQPFQQFQGGMPGVHQIPYNPYTTPFGGLGAEETVDGVPVKDLALFVGQNPHYYLPKFKEMSVQKKAASWNWSAFFLDSFFLFYRKMWGWAAIYTVLTLLLSLPSLIIFYNAMLFNAGTEMLISENTLFFLDNLSNVCYILSLALKLAVGVFSNWMYKKTVYRKIRKLQAEKQDAPDYSSLLTAKGGVSKKAVIICVVITMLLSFFMSFTMMSAVFKLY